MLYNKYRPSKFSELMGDYAYIGKVFTRPGHNRSHMFIGMRGCGKTTTARIIASEILDADEFEIYEYNYADTKGIDTSREIIDKCQYAPRGNYRVFIIDEFHQATGAASEALLKVFEEPPPYVYFFVCTSKPEKIDAAIMSRCMRHTFSALKEDDIISIVTNIATKEGGSLSPKHALQIAEASGGSARDAINILEAVLSCEETQRSKIILTATVQGSEGSLKELATAYFSGKYWENVYNCLDNLKKQAVNPESIRYYLLAWAANTLNASTSAKASVLLEPTWDSGIDGLIIRMYKGFNKEVL